MPRKREETGPVDTGTRTEQRVTDDDERERLLAVLEDRHSRAILEATGKQPLSARELAEECDISLSTTYRKIRTLVETGVLEKRVRVRASHEQKHEYVLRVEHIEIQVTPGSDVELTVTWTDEQSGRANHPSAPRCKTR